MKGLLAIWAQGIKTAFSSRMAYRFDFFTSGLIMLLSELVVPFVTVMIYRNGVSFPGWDLYEVLLVQALFQLSKGITYPLFFGVFTNVLLRVQEGTFDLLLIKPRSVLMLSIITGIDLEDMGKLISGTTLLLIALSHLPPFPPIQWLSFFGVFFFSLIMIISFSIILASVSLKWVGNFRLFEVFQTVSSYGTYPISIFPKGIQNLISYAIPVAMIAFLPASVLLGRPVPFLALSMLISGLFFGFSLLLWKFMLSQYNSAGG